MDKFNFKILIIISFISFLTVSSSPLHPNVIIIGTGAAGIAAGTKLYENGIKNILWLEAENRIGGRIDTRKFGVAHIDYGAQFCHGEKDNVVFEMANPLGLLEHSIFNFSNSDLLPDFYTPSGEMLPKIEVEKVNSLIEEVINDQVELGRFNGSVGQLLDLKFSEKLKNELKNIDENICYYVKDWTNKSHLSNDASDNLYELSAKRIAEYGESEGDNGLNWKGRGYKTVLDLMMKKIPDPKNALPLDDKILFNKEVVKIIWNSDPNPNEVTVKCADGSEYKADHVIVTVSLGVLKERSDSLFQPKLPLAKINAIQGIGFGILNKLIFEFDHPWWSTDKLHNGFTFVWKENEFEEQVKKFNGSEESNRWLFDVLGFYPIERQPNMLLGWIVSESARHMEKIPENEVKSKLIQLMRIFLGRKFKIPEPTTFIRSQWFTNPHFLGSYSFHSMTTEKLNARPTDVAEPLKNSAGKDVITFAGEATNPIHYATVHGAIETGWREADRLLKLVRL
ncbi:spermine oxidase-like [Chrysoperla carnea]|uniref:spermine oxidase-like n=1 Tax=Chrysoperla carnea TaxID=189513 RepID=UPI001D090046|nr:spermine oxidase-like [Chrysoperla carnea]